MTPPLISLTEDKLVNCILAESDGLISVVNDSLNSTRKSGAATATEDAKQMSVIL